MAKRKRGKKLTVSLFPFLSILACVIGTLTLLITAMALGQMDTDTMASAEEFQRIQDDIEEERQKIEDKKEKIEKAAKADSALAELADARVKLEELRLKKEALLAPNDEEEKSPIEIPDVEEEKHKKEIATMQAEIAKQEALIEELAAQLKEMGGPVREAEVVIQPTGSGVDLDPTFVECTEKGIVILEADPPKYVRREDLAFDEDFCALLDEVTNRPKATVIFLIRDNGLPTYFAASGVARARYTPNGKVPVIGQGKIDVGLFKK